MKLSIENLDGPTNGAGVVEPIKKRGRKPRTVRVRQPVDAAIVAIRKNAAAAVQAWRLAEASGGVLARMLLLVARLTPEHRTALVAACQAPGGTNSVTDPSAHE